MLNGQNSVLADLEINGQRAGEVIPSVAIDRILILRENGLKQYAEALDMLNSARKLLLAATGGEYLYGFELCVKDALSWADQPERAQKDIKKSVDAKIWHRLMSETGMFTLMSGKQRDEWDRQTDGEDMPEITLDTVLATFEQLHTHKNDTFEQGVIDVFRSLSWDYRTNNPCKFGKKIIVSRLFNTYSSAISPFHFQAVQRSTIWRKFSICWKGETCRIIGFPKGRNLATTISRKVFQAMPKKGNISPCGISKRARRISHLTGLSW